MTPLSAYLRTYFMDGPKSVNIFQLILQSSFSKNLKKSFFIFFLSFQQRPIDIFALPRHLRAVEKYVLCLRGKFSDTLLLLTI